MQKNKSPSVGRRILPRKWRKNKLPQPKNDGDSWSPEGNCRWSSAAGQQVTLTPINLTSLSEAERLALQKLAVARLQAFELGVNITIPKDAAKRKRSGLNTLRRRATSAANLTALLDNFKGTSVKESPKAKVFGVPLSKCISNDKEMRHRRSSLLRERQESLDLARTPRRLRKSSSSSGGAFSSDSLDLDSRDSRESSGNLLEALSLSTSSQRVESQWKAQHRSLHPSGPQVPYVVDSCVKHIETYGLTTLGIFRKGSSKKKTKQLKEEFNSGQDVKLGDEHNPHEVAALLKEYFRDLPDPLLTRELYSCFLASRKIADSNQRLLCLHYLLMLLPAANRDTLWTLLKFLMLVSQHSKDSYDQMGHQFEGNKMDSHNLATLFGPNILHKARGGLEREYQVEHSERAAHSGDVIAIVKDMIDNYAYLFMVPAELHNEVLIKIKETNSEWVDVLLRKKLTSIIEPDPDTQTSCCDESDSGSMPRSPSATSEPGGGLPRSFTEGMMFYMDQKRVRPTLQFHSADPPTDSSRDEKVMTPQAGAWYLPESRSPSPRSPQLVRKQPPRETKLRLNVPQNTSDRSRSPSVESRKGLPPSGVQHRKTSPQMVHRDNRLAVPAYSRESSTSSQGSSYPNTPGSSPGTRGPPSPMLSSDPSSREPSPLRPSSLQRPLGIPRPRPRSAAPRTLNISPEVVATQRQRWRQWEQMAKKNSEDFHEQETLV